MPQDSQISTAIKPTAARTETAAGQCDCEVHRSIEGQVTALTHCSAVTLMAWNSRADFTLTSATTISDILRIRKAALLRKPGFSKLLNTTWMRGLGRQAANLAHDRTRSRGHARPVTVEEVHVPTPRS